MIRLNPGQLLLLALALLIGIPRTAQAAESYDNCTGFITSVPAVINTQGTWCLKQDLATAIASGNAISINTSNVTLDCNDFKIGGLGAGLGTQAVGIYAQSRLNVTVRHCNVRGFIVGVFLANTSGAGGGHTVEDNRFDGNTWEGIDVRGDGSVVRRNQVSNTGGSTNPPGAFGISTSSSADVIDNSVSSVMAAVGSVAPAAGITMGNNPDGSISGNRIRHVLNAGGGEARGIYLWASERVAIRNNDLVDDAASGSTGLKCQNSSHSQAKDNVISGFATGMVACVDAGGNVIAP